VLADSQGQAKQAPTTVPVWVVVRRGCRVRGHVATDNSAGPSAGRGADRSSLVAELDQEGADVTAAEIVKASPEPLRQEAVQERVDCGRHVDGAA